MTNSHKSTGPIAGAAGEDPLGWLFALDVAAGGLERQIYRNILTAILDRRLPPGARLPASRALAASLGVSRGTVVAAFDQLVAEGYLEARTGRGTRVAALPADLLRPAAGSGAAAEPGPVASQRAADFARAKTRGGIEPRCFQAGMPSIEDFPRREWSRCLAARARTIRAGDMTYDNAAGLLVLRRAIAAHLNRARGVVAEPDQVVVIPSAQAGFMISALTTTDPGEVIAMEDPGYHNARTVFLGAGARIAPVRVDAEGIDVADLARVGSFRLVAVTPSHQYPTGVTMSLERRLRLLDLARARGAFVLEDDYDSEFRYAERPIASLQGIDGGRNVIYLGTFSKSLAPGVRVAYLVLPGALAETVARAAPGIGQVVSGPVQAALADFINEGYLAAHIGRMRVIYAAKRDALVAALRASLPRSCTVPMPRGGLQLLVGLPDEADDAGICARLAAIGIDARPLSALCVRSRGRGLFLGFALPRIEEIAPAARRLAAVVVEALAARSPRGRASSP
jgi:GntR family transcriptional regulator/MocR family aminotransferase